MKKLQKSNSKVICGVCGGIAEYFNIDATIVRLICIVAVVFGFGTGILLYILAALIIPSPDLSDYEINNMKSANMDNENTSSTSKDEKTSAANGKMHSDKDFNNDFN